MGVFTTGLILPYLDIVFVGLHILLRVRINYYAACRPLTLPYDLLGVRIFCYACGYLYDLMLCKKIVLMF